MTLRTTCVALLFVLAACGAKPGHAPAYDAVGFDIAGLRGEGVDSIGDTYARLERKQLSSADPYQDQLVIDCEIQRIVQIYEVNDALRILRNAQARAIRPQDADAKRRVDRALALKVFTAEERCPEFAAQGKLGGLWVPIGGPAADKLRFRDSLK